MLAQDIIKKIEKTIGYTFRDEALLTQAFTMPSYRNEHPDARDNLVLEFFGEMVLSHVVSDILLGRYTFRDDSGLVSYMQEDAFTNMHYNCMAKSYLANKMRVLKLEQYLVLGGEGDAVDQNVLAALFESLAAAIYLDTDKDMAMAYPILTSLLGL